MRSIPDFLLAAVLAILPAASFAAPAPIPVEEFFKRSSFEQIKISPDGRHLAAIVPLEFESSLVIMDIESKKITGSFRPSPDTYIGQFYWVNPTRVLFTTGVKRGRDEQASWSGVWYAINADGSGVGKNYGFGYNAILLSLIDDDDKSVLVQFRGNDGGTTQGFQTYGYMNVNNGDIRPTQKRAPDALYGSFIADNNADVRLYITAKTYKDAKVYGRKNADADWQLIYDQKKTGQSIEFMGFSADSHTAYFSMSEKEGSNGLYAYDFSSGSFELVTRDRRVDPADLVSDPAGDAVYAVRFNDGYPRYEVLDKTNPMVQDLAKLQNAFPDADVVPVSATQNGRKVVYVVRSDTQAGDYYLFDRDSQKAEHLVSAKAWLDPKQMAMMEPMKFKARDGMEIEVFVTLPRGSNGKNLPMIVNPHGGPFGPYDQWGFDPEIQLLANRGYAVMQVNFRGSGNYGQSFMEAGYEQWGKAMQDDLTDATRWAIQQGIADPNRICMYGASYGAYASLMGAAKEPNLYRCVVGNVGTYDLTLQISGTTRGGGRENGLKTYFNDVAQEDLASVSPVFLAGRIKVPVFLAAGEKDTTCPPEQSKYMQSALNKAGNPTELVIYPGEGHGNRKVENQIDLANRILAFFDKHTNPGKASTGELQPVK